MVKIWILDTKQRMYQVYFFRKYDMFNITIVVPLYDTSPRHTSIGRVNLLWNVSAAIPHSSFGFCHWGAKGGSIPLASDLWGVVFVFTMIYFSQPQTSKYCDFPSLFKGFMMHYCAKTPWTSVESHIIHSFMVVDTVYRLHYINLLIYHGQSNLPLLGWGG